MLPQDFKKSREGRVGRRPAFCLALPITPKMPKRGLYPVVP